MDGWNHYTPTDHRDAASDCVFTLSDGSTVTLTRAEMKTMAEQGEVEV